MTVHIWIYFAVRGGQWRDKPAKARVLPRPRRDVAGRADPAYGGCDLCLRLARRAL